MPVDATLGGATLRVAQFFYSPSTCPADGSLPSPLLGFLGAEVAEDPPVGEAEGVGHGVTDIGLGIERRDIP